MDVIRKSSTVYHLLNLSCRASCLDSLELGILTKPIVYKSGQAVEDFLLTEELSGCIQIGHSKAFLAPKASSMLTVFSQSLINL